MKVEVSVDPSSCDSGHKARLLQPGQAAAVLHRSEAALGAYLRRMKARLGAPEAITATAHKLARLIYFTLKKGWSYFDKGTAWYERQFRIRLLKSLQSRALQFGYVLIPATTNE